MHYRDFFKLLSERPRSARIEVEALRSIVDAYHHGVGQVTFKYFQDFPGAQFGMFVWLEEERTSPYEEPFRNAVVYINDAYREDRPMRRLIGAKELMHVFDGEEEQTNTPEKYRALLQEIESSPVPEDMSIQYAADRIALWKATIALIPPWIREEFREGWINGSIKAPELAARLWLPEPTVSAAMGDYYDVLLKRFLGEG